jgi:hypothetical protein
MQPNPRSCSRAQTAASHVAPGALDTLQSSSCTFSLSTANGILSRGRLSSAQLRPLIAEATTHAGHKFCKTRNQSEYFTLEGHSQRRRPFSIWRSICTTAKPVGTLAQIFIEPTQSRIGYRFRRSSLAARDHAQYPGWRVASSGLRRRQSRRAGLRRTGVSTLSHAGTKTFGTDQAALSSSDRVHRAGVWPACAYQFGRGRAVVCGIGRVVERNRLHGLVSRGLGGRRRADAARGFSGKPCLRGNRGKD